MQLSAGVPCEPAVKASVVQSTAASADTSSQREGPVRSPGGPRRTVPRRSALPGRPNHEASWIAAATCRRGSSRRVRCPSADLLASSNWQLHSADSAGFHQPLLDFPVSLTSSLDPTAFSHVVTDNARGISPWLYRPELLRSLQAHLVRLKAAHAHDNACSSQHASPASEAFFDPLARATVRATEGPAFRALRRHRSQRVSVRSPGGRVARAARQPAGTGSAQILRNMSPNSRRVRCSSPDSRKLL